MYKVILIDDEPLILKGLTRRVDWTGLGFEIGGTFSDPNDVMDYFQTDFADLALMDIRMPNMSGIELMERIRQCSNCHFIVVSGHSEFAYAQAAIQLGAVDYLLKPVANHVLTAAVITVKQALGKATESRSMRLQRALFSGGRLAFDEEFLHSLDIYRLPRAFYCCVCAAPSFACAVPDCRTVQLFCKNEMSFFLLCCYGDAAPEASEDVLLSEPVFTPSAIFPALEKLRYASYAPFLGYMPRPEAETGPLKNLMASVERAVSGGEDDNGLALVAGTTRLFRANRYPMTYFESLFNSVCSLLREQPLPGHISSDEIVAAYPSLEAAQAYLQSLFSRDRSGDQDERPRNNQQIIRAILSEMQSDYHENLTLKFFASKYYLNMTYLSRLFKSVTNETFVSLLTRIRMENSANLLSSTDLLIEQVSHACGYNDVSYFNRAFKKYFQTTPTAYRAKKRGLPPPDEE